MGLWSSGFVGSNLVLFRISDFRIQIWRFFFGIDRVPRCHARVRMRKLLNAKIKQEPEVAHLYFLRLEKIVAVPVNYSFCEYRFLPFFLNV